MTISHSVGESPSGVSGSPLTTGTPAFGVIQPHWLDLRTPRTIAPRPAAESTAPPISSLVLRGVVAE